MILKVKALTDPHTEDDNLVWVLAGRTQHGDDVVAIDGWPHDQESPVELGANHTPNGYDPLWVEAINHVLEDRESDVRITDLTDGLWNRFIGPLVDAIEDERQGDD